MPNAAELSLEQIASVGCSRASYFPARSLFLPQCGAGGQSHHRVSQPNDAHIGGSIGKDWSISRREHHPLRVDLGKQVISRRARDGATEVEQHQDARVTGIGTSHHRSLLPKAIAPNSRHHATSPPVMALAARRQVGRVKQTAATSAIKYAKSTTKRCCIVMCSVVPGVEVS